MGYMGVVCLRSAARGARGPESSNMFNSQADTCTKDPSFVLTDCLTMLYTPGFTRTSTHSDPLSPLYTHIPPSTPDPRVWPALAPALPHLSPSADVPLSSEGIHARWALMAPYPSPP